MTVVAGCVVVGAAWVAPQVWPLLMIWAIAAATLSAMPATGGGHRRTQGGPPEQEGGPIDLESGTSGQVRDPG